MWREWKRGWMWRKAAQQVLGRHEVGRCVHKARRVCTGGLRGAVEEVGKDGRVGEVGGGISNSPETHSRVLEMWSATYIPGSKREGRDVHFSSVNYGDYGFIDTSFFYSPYETVA